MATPTSDPFVGRSEDLGTPFYIGAFAITPGTAFPFTPRAIYVGGAGNINATGMDGNAIVFTGLTAGSILPFRAASIASGSTTATLLLGLY